MTSSTSSASTSYVADTGCCPRFDPGPWRSRELVWQDKLFMRDHVRSVMHVPILLKRKIVRDYEQIHAAQADTGERLILVDERSAWGADYYFAVAREVPGADMARLSGTFWTRVFEGPFRDAGKWMDEMRTYVSVRGAELEHLYFWYTTCPRCAKAYGENYVVAFAQVRAPQTPRAHVV